MASGNPFRASLAINQTSNSSAPASSSSKASAPVPQTSFINTDSSVPEARRGDSDYVLEDTHAPPTKTKKSVRIISPTTTIPPHPDFDNDDDVTLNELMARRSSQSQPASPPPPVNPTGFANSTVTAGEANAQMLGRDVMATPEILPNPRPHLDRPQAALSPSNVPSNPFSRTLASLEPQEKESEEERTRAQRPTPGNHRASLDVEGFKNLLLTGKATPRPSGQPPQTTSVQHPVSGAHFESSSSTDTSSISRQSLFEHPQETHTESPRTSVDMADSDEDESMGLVSEVKKGKKKPPPAPKHRHGKLVVQRQPQTVSFDNFAATTPIPPAIRRTDSSDMNKPLPPTPTAAPQPLHISTQDTTPLQSPSIPPSRRSEPSTPSESSTRQKRAPPPVPLARRQSQLKTASTTGNRSRSSSNLTINSQHSADALTSPQPHNSDPMSSAKSPPPPPPSRHGARLANLSYSSANSSSTELPQRSSSNRTARSIPDPPSSRRSTMESEAPTSPTPGVNRTSSISSNRKVSGGSTGSGSQMPPPPPPPRRGKRDSLDQQRPYITSPTESRRTSTEYNRRSSTEHRRTSVASESSLRREYMQEKGNEYALYSPNEERENRLGVDEVGKEGKRSESNILDDMEKFQREIDELRLRTGQAQGQGQVG